MSDALRRGARAGADTLMTTAIAAVAVKNPMLPTYRLTQIVHGDRRVTYRPATEAEIALGGGLVSALVRPAPVGRCRACGYAGPRVRVRLRVGRVDRSDRRVCLVCLREVYGLVPDGTGGIPNGTRSVTDGGGNESDG